MMIRHHRQFPDLFYFKAQSSWINFPWGVGLVTNHQQILLYVSDFSVVELLLQVQDHFMNLQVF